MVKLSDIKETIFGKPKEGPEGEMQRTLQDLLNKATGGTITNINALSKFSQTVMTGLNAKIEEIKKRGGAQAKTQAEIQAEIDQISKSTLDTAASIIELARGKPKDFFEMQPKQIADFFADPYYGKAFTDLLKETNPALLPQEERTLFEAFRSRWDGQASSASWWPGDKRTHGFSELMKTEQGVSFLQIAMNPANSQLYKGFDYFWKSFQYDTPMWHNAGHLYWLYEKAAPVMAKLTPPASQSPASQPPAQNSATSMLAGLGLDRIGQDMLGLLTPSKPAITSAPVTIAR